MKTKIKLSTSAGIAQSIEVEINKMVGDEIRATGMPSPRDYNGIYEFRLLCMKVETALEKVGHPSSLFVGSHGVVSTLSRKRDSNLPFEDDKAMLKAVSALERLGFSFSKDKPKKKKIGSNFGYAEYTITENDASLSLSIEPSYAFQ